jgi:hypothetical protein
VRAAAGWSSGAMVARTPTDLLRELALEDNLESLRYSQRHDVPKCWNR